jgi:hypothetical protein
LEELYRTAEWTVVVETEARSSRRDARHITSAAHFLPCGENDLPLDLHPPQLVMRELTRVSLDWRAVNEPFKFTEPRHQRLYAALAALMGDGPAAHFRDACRLLEADPAYESANNLIGNLLREIESALRETCLLLVSGRSDTAQSYEQHLDDILSAHNISSESRLALDLGDLIATIKDEKAFGQKAEVRAVLDGLDVRPRDAVEVAWLGIARELYKLTHRRGLAAPRPLSSDREAFERLFLILDALVPHALLPNFLDR